MKINKQNKINKEFSIVYGDDNSINVNIFILEAIQLQLKEIDMQMKKLKMPLSI